MSTRARTGAEAPSYSEGKKKRCKQVGEEANASFLAQQTTCSGTDVGPSGSLSVSQNSGRTPRYDKEVDRATRTHKAPMLLPPLPCKLAEKT